MESMYLFRRIIILFVLVITGCEPKKQDIEVPKKAISQKKEGKIEQPTSRFVSKDRTEDQIIKDFPKPVRTYPSISQDEVEVHDGGVLYRKNINRPFTGRVIEKFKDGTVSLESSYLDGLPHGQQLRRFKSGKPALEAIFDQGILSGIKTKWWRNGNIREEEYWSEGKFFGRRLWDESGRMIREEMVPSP